MANTWLDCMIQSSDSPSTFLASVAGSQMIVSSMIAGAVAPGQDLAGRGIAPGTRVVGYEDGFGGTGTYCVRPQQSVQGDVQITATMTLPGRVQPLDSVDQLLLAGEAADQALYLSGAVERLGVSTIVQLPDGSSWRAVAELGRWAGWLKLAVKQIATLSLLDFSNPTNSGLVPTV